jgi:hypothetical protein
MEDKEKQLVEKYITLKAKHKDLKAQAADVWRESEQVEAELIEHMEDLGKDRTASYPGLGFMGQRLEVYYNRDAEHEAELFDYLKKIGREDLITTKVNSTSMKTFIKNVIEDELQGHKVDKLPEWLDYKMTTKLRHYKG